MKKLSLYRVVSLLILGFASVGMLSGCGTKSRSKQETAPATKVDWSQGSDTNSADKSKEKSETPAPDAATVVKDSAFDFEQSKSEQSQAKQEEKPVEKSVTPAPSKPVDSKDKAAPTPSPAPSKPVEQPKEPKQAEAKPAPAPSEPAKPVTPEVPSKPDQSQNNANDIKDCLATDPESKIAEGDTATAGTWVGTLRCGATLKEKLESAVKACSARFVANVDNKPAELTLKIGNAEYRLFIGSAFYKPLFFNPVAKTSTFERKYMFQSPVDQIMEVGGMTMTTFASSDSKYDVNISAEVELVDEKDRSQFKDPGQRRAKLEENRAKYVVDAEQKEYQKLKQDIVLSFEKGHLQKFTVEVLEMVPGSGRVQTVPGGDESKPNVSISVDYRQAMQAECLGLNVSDVK